MMLPSRYSSFVMIVMLPSLLLAAQSKSSSSGTSAARGQPRSKTSTATPKKKSSAAPKPAAKKPARRPARVPIRQARPTRARYREIQQALADAGYYSEAIDGIWGDHSAAALKQFQEEQELEPTGKLDALTLIRLGLGPQYETPENASAAGTPAPG